MSVRALITAGPDFAMGAYAVLLWTAPALFGGADAINGFALFYITEFFVTHASGFIGHYLFFETGVRRAGHLAFFCAVYGFFSALLGYFFQSWAPLIAFWVLLGNRLLPVFLARAPLAERQNAMGLLVARNVGVYLLSALLSVLPLPRLGVTMPVLSPTGEVSNDPHKLLAICAFYFLVQGWLTLRLAPPEEREAA